MSGLVKFNIFRNDEFVFGGAKKHNEVNDAIIEFLKLCNDDATYDVDGWTDDHECVLDVHGSIERICKLLRSEYEDKCR